MKLRNKNTGQDGNFIINKDHFECVDLDYVPSYFSLSELLDEWEDYKPKEPLIKDEKIRKAVRAWAEANEIVKAFVIMNKNMNWIVYGDDIDRNRFMIEFFDRVVSENDEPKNFTIAELCGDEEK